MSPPCPPRSRRTFSTFSGSDRWLYRGQTSWSCRRTRPGPCHGACRLSCPRHHVPSPLPHPEFAPVDAVAGRSAARLADIGRVGLRVRPTPGGDSSCATPGRVVPLCLEDMVGRINLRRVVGVGVEEVRRCARLEVTPSSGGLAMFSNCTWHSHAGAPAGGVGAPCECRSQSQVFHAYPRSESRLKSGTLNSCIVDAFSHLANQVDAVVDRDLQGACPNRPFSAVHVSSGVGAASSCARADSSPSGPGTSTVAESPATYGPLCTGGPSSVGTVRHRRPVQQRVLPRREPRARVKLGRVVLIVQPPWSIPIDRSATDRL